MLKFAEFFDENGQSFLINAKHIHSLYSTDDGHARLHILTPTRDKVIDLDMSFKDARHKLRMAV